MEIWRFNRWEVKVVIYDGSGLWLDYEIYFNIVGKFNEWIEEEKGLFFVVFFCG